jgi:hypothetical protein
VTLPDWRDLAVALLAIEAFLIGLVPAVALFFAVRGMRWVTNKVRHGTPIVQGYFQRAARISEKASRRVATPIIRLAAEAARARQLTHVRSVFFHHRQEV